MRSEIQTPMGSFQDEGSEGTYTREPFLTEFGLQNYLASNECYESEVEKEGGCFATFSWRELWDEVKTRRMPKSVSIVPYFALRLRRQALLTAGVLPVRPLLRSTG